MNELLEKINKTFDDSISSCNDETALQLRILKGNINTLFNEAMAEEVEVLKPSVPQENRKKILVVDDSSVIRNYIDKICSMTYNVLMASGGEEAINVLDSEKIDALLLDLMMPGVDGFAVLDHLKEINSEVPVIIISGDTTKETINRAFTYNVIDMIEKPFPEKTILEKISRVLDN